MQLKRLYVEKLFNLFTYDISFDNENQLTIITGPNGYGKTTILSIINNLFQKNFYYFSTLPFDRIEFIFDKGNTVLIKKQYAAIEESDDSFETDITGVSFEYINPGRTIIYEFNPETLFKELNERYKRVDESLWQDNGYRRKYLTTSEILENNPEIIVRLSAHVDKELLLFLNSLGNCFIKEKRLSSKVYLSSFDRDRTEIFPTIVSFADELSVKLKEYRLKSLESIQKLDSTFPERVLKQTNTLDENKYRDKLRNLQAKLSVLKEYGLSDMYISETEYNEENKRILSVYLEDAEEKTKVFDELLPQLKLFTQIISKKEFAFKKIHVNADTGFSFITNKDKELNLEYLSSGEQHEVIMIYDLLFHSQPGTLVLIDEPEISLHVAWQQEFINDMMDIAKMKNLSLIIATHSPQIIGSYSNLCIDLYYSNKNNEDY